MAKTDTRETVFDMLMSLRKHGGMSGTILSSTLESCGELEKRDRAFISRLFKGVLERRIYLDHVIARFSSLKPEKLKPAIKIILEMGAYQILFMDHVPDRAACNESVKLAGKKGCRALSGYVNGVLRSLVREKEDISLPDKDRETEGYISVRYSLPKWIAGMWLKEYGPEKTEMMGAASLMDSPLCVRLRTMLLEGSAGEERCAELAAALTAEMKEMGISLRQGELFEDAFRLDDIDRVTKIPAFRDGRLVVQDESTMLAARIAGVKATDKVIDVCGAPGGKSIHLADYMMRDHRDRSGSGEALPEGRVFSRDISERKIKLIEENIRRTGAYNVMAQLQDALQMREEDLGTAEVVVADLPCSGLGVIGRKPDIKENMKPETIEELSRLQREILAVVSSYVKEGGVLIYSTCTVSKKENEENMRWFAEHHPFRLDSIDEYLPEKMHCESSREGWLQILPGQYGSDGFFAARFVREKI